MAAYLREHGVQGWPEFIQALPLDGDNALAFAPVGSNT
jgi:hypothetical protein